MRKKQILHRDRLSQHIAEQYYSSTERIVSFVLLDGVSEPPWRYCLVRFRPRATSSKRFLPSTTLLGLDISSLAISPWYATVFSYSALLPLLTLTAPLASGTLFHANVGQITIQAVTRGLVRPSKEHLLLVVMRHQCCIESCEPRPLASVDDALYGVPLGLATLS